MAAIRARAAATGSITEGVIWKPLLMFFFPILLGSFFQQLYNTADAIIVGKFVGKEALAAVGGATGTLISLVVGFFTGLSSGATVIISQFFGARRDQEVGKAVHTAFAMAIFGGLALSVISCIFAPAILVAMDTPPEVMAYANAYIRIYFGGMIPSLIYNIGAGVLRAVGDSRRPLYFLVAACLINVLLDILLVVGLELGVQGAAIATVLSQIVSAALVFATLSRTPLSYRLHPRKIRFHMDTLQKIIGIGFPAGLQSVMYGLSNIIIQASINIFGTDILAAWTAYGKIDGLFWMMISAFGVAITTFVGQNFGAHQYERLKKSVRVCLGMASAATLIMCVILLAFAPPLLRMFTDDAQVLEYGLEMMWLLVPTYITYICIEILSGAVRGTGSSLVPTLMTLFGICALRIVWVVSVAPAYHSVRAVLLSYPITWVITSVMFIIYYLKGGWLKRGIQRLESA